MPATCSVPARGTGVCWRTQPPGDRTPRIRQGLHVAINAILDAPGAVITTSTKPDNLKATLTARRARGPVRVFDPQGILAPTSRT